MGAAEWTGYTNSPSYTSYQTIQPNGVQSPTAASYGYDSNVAMTDHHSNFHIPTGMHLKIAFTSIYY